jgi:hypothetical protein
MRTSTAVSPGRPNYWQRISLGSGIAFMVAQIAALTFFTTMVLPKMPAIDAPVRDRADFFVEHGDLLILTNYLLVIPMLFFLLFLGGMYSFLRQVEAEANTLSAIALAAGVAMVIIWPLGLVISNIGVEIAREGGDPATVAALDAMPPYTLALSAFPKAALLAAASVAILQSRVMQRWVAWGGIAVAGITLIGSATLLVGDVFPLLGIASLFFYFWVGAFSLALLRRASSVSVIRSLATTSSMQ